MNSTNETPNAVIQLTPGQQSLKRLKEMAYTQPDGKVFVMKWREGISSTVKTSNMKNIFLSVIMVAVSFMAATQTFDSIISQLTVKRATRA
jgi:hypothetical protein